MDPMLPTQRIAEAPPIILGIDVSAAWLDGAVLGRTNSLRWPNTAAGHAALLAWLAEQPRGLAAWQVACEASGGFERDMAEALTRAGVAVRVLEAGRVRQFARAAGQRAKTDAIDARGIAACAAAFDGPLFQLDPAREGLAEALRLRDQVQAERVAAEQQQRGLRQPRLIALAEARVAQLRNWLKDLDAEVAAQIEADARLAADAALLRSVPGVGPVMVARMLAEMPEAGTLSRQKIAALAGVAPFPDDSGTRRGKRRMAGGRARLRTTLYMAAIAASRHNPVLREIHHRLRNAGKPPKVALGAVMRKLLVILNAILRTRQPWIPQATA
jgi:transposase